MNFNFCFFQTILNFSELLKDKKYSEKSDIWSFAVLAREIFTRTDPFIEYSPMDVSEPNTIHQIDTKLNQTNTK